jgi:hypothetical protein
MTDRRDQSETDEIPTPFLFKVTVVLAVAYLGWRLVQGVIWLIQALGG